MKKVFLLLLAINGLAQAPAIEWQKTFGGTDYEWPRAIKKTTDGGYIIAGATASNDGDVTTYMGGQHDSWVIKINATGILEWQRTYGGSGDDVPFEIEQTSDNGYIMSGYSSSSDGDVSVNHGLNDIWVVKIDILGSVIWQKSFGGSNYELASDVIQCIDGGYLLTGFTRSHDGDVADNPMGFDFNAFTMKLNAAGTFQWQKFYGGTQDESFTNIHQQDTGGFVLSGNTASNDRDVSGNHGGVDFWIVETDESGTLLWQKTIGGSDNESVSETLKTIDGGFIVAGYSYSTNGDVTGNHGDDDAWIVKLDAQAQIEWQKMYGGTDTDRAYGIAQTADSGYVISGSTLSSDGDVAAAHFGYEGWVFKIDANGIMQWNKSLGGTLSDDTNKVLAVADGYLIAGDTNSYNGDVTFNHGLGDLWVVKLGLLPLSDAVFTQNDFSVYPNPVTNLLQIKLQNQSVINSIIIKDLSGKTILEQTQNTNQINTQNLASGIYFLEAIANNKIYKTKFIKK